MPNMSNEKTGARVAKIAGKYVPMTLDQFIDAIFEQRRGRAIFLDIKRLAASCLTQAPDKRAGDEPQELAVALLRAVTKARKAGATNVAITPAFMTALRKIAGKQSSTPRSAL